MGFSSLPRRFSDQGRHTLDHWQNEKLIRTTVANTPENLLKINKIFSFHSDFMQNIIDFKENNFAIRILTQPFLANSSSALAKQAAPRAQCIFRQYLAFLQAARDWDMDFIDFSDFQVLPGDNLRFAWKLDKQNFPSAESFIPVFNKNKFLRSLNKSNYRNFQKSQKRAAESHPASGHLYRSDDFASNIFQAYSLAGVKSNANLKININTKEPLQKNMIRNTLFHNLDSEEILFIHIAADGLSLREMFSGFCRGRKAEKNDAAALAGEFGLYLRQSVYRKTILVIDGPGGKDDGPLLRFLLESGDISDLTVIQFNHAMSLDCDLELNEDPDNPLQKYLALQRPAQNRNRLSARESELLKIFSLAGVPLPIAVASELAGPDSTPVITSLLEKQYLQGNRNTLSLCAPGDLPLDPGPGSKRMLESLAARTGWPYLVIRHFIVSERWTELERYLEKFARQGSEKIAPGPAADLLVSHLPRLAKSQKLLSLFLEILIKTDSLHLADNIFAEYADPDHALTRLQSAHLAMRKKDYSMLERRLRGFSRVPKARIDEWLYLNFIAREKTSETKKADAFANKIKDPYYKNLSVVQLSDRKIYHGDYAKAGSLLEGALGYFQAQQCLREEIEIQNQVAKLKREQGCFHAAESLYKSTFIKSESAGFGLHSAFTAVDLGNLYLENDDDFQAESWYQKALRWFEKEKNHDGIMLVNANLINIFIGSGNWKEADVLLRSSLAHNEEKKLFVSCAIDCLNWAVLEYLRLNNAQALQLLERAAHLFAGTGNNKGLAECASLKGIIFSLDSRTPDPLPAGVNSFTSDQKIVWRICQQSGPAIDEARAAAIKKQLAAIQSKKIRFTALVMLLRKLQQPQWLDMLRDVSQELSEKSKNYFFFEYWYVYFEQTADPDHIDSLAQDNFLAMYDFFSMNKRNISKKINRLRSILAEHENQGHLFDDARLVENYRQWRLPEDFFNSFFYELGKALKIDWLTMQVFEEERLLFRFSSSPLFGEIGDEMLRSMRTNPENQNLRLAEIKLKFASREKFFYPFANTKMGRWPLPGDRCAYLAVAFKDAEAYFQNFFERNRDVLNKFALLFQNFFENEYQIQEKLDFIIGASDKIKEMKRLIAQVSKVDFSLLICGESGSGKELVAQAVHRLSPRANRPFVSVNAAALPETLLEAELFGFKKGAFSGATENRVGLLEAADRGTFFLDEIADLPLNLQAKLLRALQEKEIRRLGENKTVPIDIRLISASNKNVHELIQANRFREDFFFRLQDLTIHIPPLRERREDIPLLVSHFLKKFGHPADDPLKLQAIADRFRNDSFPGNVRELESEIKKLITFNPGLEQPVPVGKNQCALKIARQNFDRSLLLNTMHETRWNRNQSAEKLGISRMALFNLLKKYGIKK